MILNIDRVTELCTKYSITPSQFYLLYCIATQDWENLNKYMRSNGTFPMGSLDDLRSKGLLIFMDKLGDHGEPLISPDDMVVDRNFLKDTVADKDEAYDRLEAAYPWEFHLNGNNFPARTGKPRENNNLFFKHVKGDPAVIEEVIDLTNYGRANGLITMGLEKYIERRHWLYIKLKRAEGSTGGFMEMG